MIHMRRDDVRYLAGSEEVQVRPVVPFDEQVCDFLDGLSKVILKDSVLKSYPDVVSFAFWIRRGNICKQKELFQSQACRIGKGLAFHIAPSNVPINFAYSFVFGLLAGNSNIVRVSSKDFSQVRLLCEKIQEVMERKEYGEIRQGNAIVMYDRNKEITDAFSAICDVRVIWGGDRTIAEIRTSPLKPRAKEIVFADRYSLGIINPDAILEMSEQDRNALAEKFYNDTYLMDQNACSAPHIIFWKSEQEEKVKKAQELFWKAVFMVAKKYELADSKVSDKYTDVCLYAAKHKGEEEQAVTGGTGKVRFFENLLYVVDLEKVPEEIMEFRGRFGMFYECQIASLDEITHGITEKVQTVAVEGVESQEVKEFVIANHLSGIDRIVPFGSTLDIGLIWDGYDLIGEMSRIVL